MYYEDLKADLDKHKALYVYPVLYGYYEWKNQVDGCVLYETSNTQTFVRGGLNENKLMQKDQLKSHGTYILPRLTSSEQIIKALKKMDETRFDGTCVVQTEDTLFVISSLLCVQAQLQFKSYLLEVLPQCDSISALQDNVELCEDWDCKFFAVKFFLYLLYRLRECPDSWKDCLHEILQKNSTIL